MMTSEVTTPLLLVPKIVINFLNSLCMMQADNSAQAREVIIEVDRQMAIMKIVK